VAAIPLGFRACIDSRPGFSELTRDHAFWHCPAAIGSEVLYPSVRASMTNSASRAVAFELAFDFETWHAEDVLRVHACSSARRLMLTDNNESTGLDGSYPGSHHHLYPCEGNPRGQLGELAQGAKAGRPDKKVLPELGPKRGGLKHPRPRSFTAVVRVQCAPRLQWHMFTLGRARICFFVITAGQFNWAKPFAAQTRTP